MRRTVPPADATAKGVVRPCRSSTSGGGNVGQRPRSCSVAASADTGRERWFARGSVRDALLASCALPAVFPPVEIDGERYIDGGVVNNVPISRALALGAHRIWVFHVGNFPRPRSDFRRPV